MNPAEIQRLLTNQPFKPFRLHFPSRTSYTVSSLGQVTPSGDGADIDGASYGWRDA